MDIRNVEPEVQAQLQQEIPGGIRNISDLTIAELYELMIKAVRECKRLDAEEAKVAYQEKWPSKITKE